jgi:hypothetical protein
MPGAVTLVRREGVELARTGSWAISSGTWEPTPQDLAAAVAAQACPAVRRPHLKIGHVDPRFDGEPAIGWVENLRLADGGPTLLGDYVDMPDWLDGVLASAWPDRSVEGRYAFRCQLGHTHPFVVSAVALLGVTPPGVGTLAALPGRALAVASAERPVHAVFAATDESQLKRYWTKSPEGLAKWAKSRHPWTALYRHLKDKVGAERAKRIASEWYHEVFGHWPGEKRGKS